MPVEPVRIAFVIDSLTAGGAQKHLTQIARGLRANGCDVWVYVLNDINAHSTYRTELTGSGVTLHFFGFRKVFSGVALFVLARELQEKRVQVCTVLLFASTVFGRIACALARTPMLVTCVQARNINFHWWQFAALRMTSMLSDVSVVNSNAIIEFAEAREGRSRRGTILIQNAVTSPDSTFGGVIAQQRPEVPFPEHSVLIGTVGRLHPQKGFDVLLRSMPLVLASIPRARLIIVGEGASLGELKRLASSLKIENEVFFAGIFKNPDEILRLLDVYVQPSRFEGAPNAVMEAMAHGIPVVATAIDGIRDLIRDGVTGWLVPADNVAALAFRLVETCLDLRSAGKIGDAGASGIVQRFPVSRLVDAYLHLFRRLTRESPISSRDETIL
jgi:glycosyltransferase involved in cell wall biosynthesis